MDQYKHALQQVVTDASQTAADGPYRQVFADAPFDGGVTQPRGNDDDDITRIEQAFPNTFVNYHGNDGTDPFTSLYNGPVGYHAQGSTSTKCLQLNLDKVAHRGQPAVSVVFDGLSKDLVLSDSQIPFSDDLNKEITAYQQWKAGGLEPLQLPQTELSWAAGSTIDIETVMYHVPHRNAGPVIPSHLYDVPSHATSAAWKYTFLLQCPRYKHAPPSFAAVPSNVDPSYVNKTVYAGETYHKEVCLDPPG